MTEHSISIGSPRLEGKMGSKYTSYCVTTAPQGWSVRRRYSEFAWLRSTLLQRYPGMFVPSLPSKVKSSAISTEKRMLLLGCFLDQLSDTELLGDDEASVAFLSLDDHGEWSKMLHHLTELPHERTKQWCEACLGGDTTPTDLLLVGQEIKVYQQRLLSHEKHLTKLLSSSRSLAKSSQALSLELMKVGVCAQAYSESEKAISHGDAATNSLSSGGGGHAEDDAMIQESLDHLAGAFTEWGKQTALEPVIFQKVMSIQIEYQIQQVGAFRELLTAREAVVLDLEKRKKKLGELEAQRATGHTETKGSKFGSYSKYMPSSLVAHKEPLEDAIAAEEKGVQETKEAVKVVTNSLFEQEFERFDADRGLAYRHLVGMVAVGMLKVQEDVRRAWEENDAGVGSGGGAAEMKERVMKVVPDFDNYGATAAAKGIVLEVEEVAEAP
eukprot:CAMPEP_0171779522 /NCGR_PEP_ID=MMETSP0991-20121206/59059_1 /TAXON_ID=483369 /ORGANISM="non described non described, Strain CCMP2098" /LENGTH=439 /DNA_ID=CAMNT_0012386707 /DNA_START=36 /DNA_END=1355 /DNA_ORIENTATION=-